MVTVGGKRYFKAAIDCYRDLSDEEKEKVASNMANILNLYGMMESSGGTSEGISFPDESGNVIYPVSEEALAIDRLFVDDPILRKHADQDTLLNALLRASEGALRLHKYDDSTELSGKALKLLDKQPASSFDKDWRISAELLHVAAQKGAGQLTAIKILDQLDKLVKKVEGKDYDSFERLLKRRVVLSREIGDKEKYVAYLEYLQKYNKDVLQALQEEDPGTKQVSADMLWYVDEFLKSTELLVRHFIEAKDKEKVVTLLQAAKKDSGLAEQPFRHWLVRFPKEFIDQAFPPKSVLGLDNK